MTKLFAPTRKALVATSAALLVVLSGNGPRAGAAPAATAAAAGIQSAQATHQQLVQSLHVLQSTKKTLEMADHDYGGHRAAAVHDIGKAERQLREALGHSPHHKARAVGARTGGGKVAGNREPQQLSNEQLAAAIPVLQNTVAALKNANHDFGGHREKAIEDLNTAVAQLKTALQYAKEHDQNKK
jgi:hypothetical protein